MGPEKPRKRWENVAKRKKRLLLVKTVKTHDFPFDHGEYARKTRRIWWTSFSNHASCTKDLLFKSPLLLLLSARCQKRSATIIVAEELWSKKMTWRCQTEIKSTGLTWRFQRFWMAWEWFKHVRCNPDAAPRLTPGGYENKTDVITPINRLFIGGGEFWCLMKIKLMLLPQPTYCS